MSRLVQTARSEGLIWTVLD